MSSGLEGRVERLMEALDPQPAQMIAVVIVRFGGSVDPAALRDGEHAIGKYATACLLGGSARERRRELKRLRESGAYDRDPWGQRAISGDEVKSVSGGSTVGDPGP